MDLEKQIKILTYKTNKRNDFYNQILYVLNDRGLENVKVKDNGFSLQFMMEGTRFKVSSLFLTRNDTEVVYVLSFYKKNNRLVSTDSIKASTINDSFVLNDCIVDEKDFAKLYIDHIFRFAQHIN